MKCSNCGRPYFARIEDILVLLLEEQKEVYNLLLLGLLISLIFPELQNQEAELKRLINNAETDQQKQVFCKKYKEFFKKEFGKNEYHSYPRFYRE